MTDLILIVLFLAVLVGAVAAFYFFPLIAGIAAGTIAQLIIACKVAAHRKEKKANDPNRWMYEELDKLTKKLHDLRKGCMGEKQVQAYADRLLERTEQLRRVVREVPYSAQKEKTVQAKLEQLNDAFKKLEKYNIELATMPMDHVKPLQKELDTMMRSLDAAREIAADDQTNGQMMQM